MRKPPFRTARCVIGNGDRFLLVVHSNRLRINRGRWGLPGGRLHPGEDFFSAARREIREELHIALGDLIEVGEYRYKGALHKVVGAIYEQPIVRFDRREILQVRWLTLADVEALSQSDRLHAGFEHDAIRQFQRLHASRATRAGDARSTVSSGTPPTAPRSSPRA